MKETTTDERAWYEMLTGLCFTGGVQNIIILRVVILHKTLQVIICNTLSRHKTVSYFHNCNQKQYDSESCSSF